MATHSIPRYSIAPYGRRIILAFDRNGEYVTWEDHLAEVERARQEERGKITNEHQRPSSTGEPSSA